ncbi:MAG: HD domain-containing protein [Thermoplasmatota archaeon]
MTTVRDPIHGSIRIEDWMEGLVASPVVQRLRRVGQLGTANLVYPGANHRRFEHSLGASHLAGRLAAAVGLSEEERRTARAASLLHDVGHGPFSHAFEELVKEEGRSHEETTIDLVQWGPLADLLRQADLRPPEVADAVLGKGPVGPIVAGTLDADRMDYLVRDAHYTGVRSGADPDRLAAVMDHDDAHGLLLRESGLVAAEAFLTTRYLMYPAVYLHHTVRASEMMLLAAIRCHLADADDGSRLADLERLGDDGLLWRLREGGGAAAELVGRLDDRRLYKRAYEGRSHRLNEPEIEELAKDPGARRAAATLLANVAGVPEHHVIVDVPRLPKFSEAAMLVRRRDGRVQRLDEASGLVAALHGARLDHWRFWVFAPRNAHEAVAKAAKRRFG